MEQSGLKDERVAHIAGSERPGERPHYSGSSRSERASSKPRTRWLRMSGQSSFSCDRKEDSPSQETKQPNEFSAAPSRSPDLPRNERRRVRPLPRFFLQNLRFFPFTRCSAVLARSLSSGRWSLGRHPRRRRGPTSRRRCRCAPSSCPSGSSSAACAKPALAEGLGRRLPADVLTSCFSCEAVRVPPLPPLCRPLVGGRPRRPHSRLWEKKRAC